MNAPSQDRDLARPPFVLAVLPEVAAALRMGAPVVALETTVVTHGLPAGAGVDTALELEALVRRHGATPATVAVLGGAVRIGLAVEEIRTLAEPGKASKLNPGNLAAAVAEGGTGSTTVAATVWMASRAGIRVMATGGIGGVHRGESGDESADLAALARFPVAVVCAGAKAVLDLPRTRERLETLGVPVFGVGTRELPAFYGRSSGRPVDRSFESLGALARALRAHWALGGAGVVVGNPIPATHELPPESYMPVLERALADASARGVGGRDLTPFLLERLREGTKGRSLEANRALLRHNAAVAAELAVAVARARPADAPTRFE